MRWVMVALLAVLAACGGQDGGGGAAATPSPTGYQRPEVPAEELRALAAYDAARPLGVTVASVENEPQWGTRVEKITFDSGGAELAEAYLVSPLNPPAGGNLAGAVYLHGRGSGPRTYLGEARRLAPKGLVVLLPSVVFSLTGQVEADTRTLREHVVRLRRAVDVLAARPGVDPARLAFLGHSWGGVMAGVLAGAEPRLAGVITMGAGDQVTEWAVRDSGVSGTAVKPYRDAVSRFDPARWVALPGSRTLLMQFGRSDTLVGRDGADALAAAAAGAKERKDYDGGHELQENNAATADREAFLTRVLRLG